MDREEEFQVEAVRGWRYCYNDRSIQFRIKWLGYDESDNTWEPRENLNCDRLLDEFIKKLPPKQARYFHVDKHHKLTGFQRNAEFDYCVGADGPHESDDEDSTKPEKQKFYFLAKFKDCNFAEEVTPKEFSAYQQELAFKFLEERILVEPKSGSKSESE